MAVFTSVKNNYRWTMLFPEQKMGDILERMLRFIPKEAKRRL